MTLMVCSSIYGSVSCLVLILFILNPVLTLSLKLRDDIRVDSKPVSLCEKTPGVESHSGYIRLPSGVLNEHGIDSAQDYPVNIFFWYFQNRKKRTDSPLTVYCFSYDFAEPGVLNADNSIVLDRHSRDTPAGLASGLRRGSFSSQNPRNTVNSTQVVARSTWFFLQVWMQKFGKRESSNNRVNFWTSSYGGHFVPELIHYTLHQNARHSQGRLDREQFIPLAVRTLGMTNACIDGPTELPYYPEMALKNNYSAPLTDQSGYLTAIHNLKKSDGCLAKIQACRDAFTAARHANLSVASNHVDDVCRDANHYCGKHVVGVASGRSYFDIAYPDNLLADPLSERQRIQRCFVTPRLCETTPQDE
ncbi:Alpha/Beta hydrolase protein [Cladorrhinum sp. PSN259]|nr:Alpha/Beta hydrolase protein [Cladorrhinum sp. PSN259]